MEQPINPQVQESNTPVSLGQNKELDKYIRQVVAHFKDGQSVQVEANDLFELDERAVREAMGQAIKSRTLDSFDQLITDLVSSSWSPTRL